MEGRARERCGSARLQEYSTGAVVTNLDGKHFILALSGLLAVLVDGLEGPCRV